MMELEASRSPEHFVYPISDTSKYAIGGDEEIDARTFVESAKQGETSTWRLSTNYRRIQVNDYVWAYFTLPRGEITSVGRVVREPFLHQSWGEWAVDIRWERSLSAELELEPIPYTAFKQRIWGAADRANDEMVWLLEGWMNGRRSKDREWMDSDVEMSFRVVSTRQGQGAFRDELLNAQSGRCAVTGCEEQAVLQAAPIKGVASKGRHSARNGLLLRADIHDLFDAGLLIIDADFTVRVHEQVDDMEYRRLDGRRLEELSKLSMKSYGPDAEALRWHRRAHQWE